jgi:hypothetical protein
MRRARFERAAAELIGFGAWFERTATELFA